MSVTYPGGRTISRTFDAIDRICTLADGPTTLTTSDWIGRGMRELRRVNGNGTALTFLNDAGNADIGFDAVRRLVRLCVLPPGGGAPIVDREYTYNRASQRTLERRHDDFGLTDRYTYDSAYRVASSSYDQDGLPGASPRDMTGISYVLDGVGNRRNVQQQSTAAGLTAETYAVNAVNEYTSITPGAAPAVPRGHDPSGNVTDDGTKLLSFDYKNRLVGVLRKADLRPIAAYGYLPDGRRSRKQIFDPDSGALLRDTRFISDGPQEVEEQDWSTGTTLTTYVWSPVYVDELVEFNRTTAHPLGAGSFYVHQDARCAVVAVSNASGAVVERRRYDDFGREEVRDGSGAVVPTSVVGLDYGFQGRRLDRETGLVFFRARTYDPALGRFIQRDPVWDASNVGGQYSFCGNGPISGRDSSGFQGEDFKGKALNFLIGVATVLAEPVNIARDVVAGESNNYSSMTFQGTEARLSSGQSKLEAGAKLGAEIFVSANPITGPAVAGWEVGRGIDTGDWERVGRGTGMLAGQALAAASLAAGPRGMAAVPARGLAAAGEWGMASAGPRGMAAAGPRGMAAAGPRGMAAAGSVVRGLGPAAAGLRGMPVAGPRGLGAGAARGTASCPVRSYPPLDPFPYEQHPHARPFGPDLEPGSYVFVRSPSGEVWVAPDGPHVHPQVLRKN